MSQDERADSAYWERLAAEKGGQRLEQLVSQKRVLVPTMFAPSYQEGLEKHYKKQISADIETARRTEAREKETLELAREANRIAKRTRMEMRYTWAAAVIVGVLTFIFSVLLADGGSAS